MISLSVASSGRVNTHADRHLSRLSLPSEPSHIADIESLLFGLAIRGRLSDRERQLLDDLGKNHSAVFLLKNQTYLHPDDLELFPPSTLHETVPAGMDGLFSQMVRSPRFSEAFRVHSTVINPGETSPIMFGMFGPRQFEPETQHTFERLAPVFRSAWKTAHLASSRVTASWLSDQPLLILHRTSGRVIAANRSAMNMLGMNEGELVDQEFTAVRPRLASALGRSRLTMENVNEGSLYISLVTIIREVATRERSASYVTDGFLHQLRNRITMLSASACHLEAMTGWKSQADESELARLISSEAASLESLVGRFSLLTNFDRLPKADCDLLQELRRALDIIRSEVPAGYTFGLGTTTDIPTLRYPHLAPAYLLESVLRTHLDQGQTSSQTSVNLECDKERITCQINTTVALANGQVRFSPTPQQYAEALAAAMGIDLVQETNAAQSTLTTTMIIHRNQI